MGEFITVGKLSDVEPGTCTSVESQGRWIALCNIDGTIYALDNTCPHAGGPLGDGYLVDHVIECPWHGWKFNVMNGERLKNPNISVACFPVRIEADDIQVAIPEHEP